MNIDLESSQPTGPIGSILGSISGTIGGMFGKSKLKKEEARRRQKDLDDAWNLGHSARDVKFISDLRKLQNDLCGSTALIASSRRRDHQ